MAFLRIESFKNILRCFKKKNIIPYEGEESEFCCPSAKWKMFSAG